MPDEQQQPIIVFTNDDGIQSPGLWAVVAAFDGLGRRVVVAPKTQQSGSGRSLAVTDEQNTGRLFAFTPPFDADTITAYAAEATPARAVQHAALEVLTRRPDLVVSGINYGDNTGNGVTISGTIGAALEAASMGVPALAVSQQTAKSDHMTYSTEIDFSIAAHYARLWGRWLLETRPLPDDLDMLKIDVPLGATLETPWKLTRHSRKRVYWPTRPDRINFEDVGHIGYRLDVDPTTAEPGSDVRTLWHEQHICITPFSLDMTARTDFERLHRSFVQKLDGE